MLTRGGNQVVGAFSTPGELEAKSLAGEPEPQAVIVDTDDLTECPVVVAAIRRMHPGVKILLLCGAVSTAVVRCAIEECVEGVVLKSDTAEEVILGLREILRGRSVMPVGWHKASLEPENRGLLGTLSVREREVLDLATRGLSNKEIATHLTISANTVKFHLRAIYSRLGVHNRVQAAQTVAQEQEV
jgi:DNA-binding NarL/FixJ family response regulator